MMSTINSPAKKEVKKNSKSLKGLVPHIVTAIAGAAVGLALAAPVGAALLMGGGTALAGAGAGLLVFGSLSLLGVALLGESFRPVTYVTTAALLAGGMFAAAYAGEHGLPAPVARQEMSQRFNDAVKGIRQKMDTQKIKIAAAQVPALQNAR